MTVIQGKDSRWVIRDGVVEIWVHGLGGSPDLRATFTATSENFRTELRTHRIAEEDTGTHSIMAELVRSARDAWQVEAGIIKPPPPPPPTRDRNDSSETPWDWNTLRGFGIGMYPLR